jgi:hypothetical protein
MREMNAHQVTITMRDGSVFRGSINIGTCRRLADFLQKTDSGSFIVMFDTTVGENKEKGVYFINRKQIVTVEPNEVDERTIWLRSVTLESKQE